MSNFCIVYFHRRGSIIVDFELIFTKKKIEDPLKPLMKVAETGKLGNMTVKMKTMPGSIRNKNTKKNYIFTRISI